MKNKLFELEHINNNVWYYDSNYFNYIIYTKFINIIYKYRVINMNTFSIFLKIKNEK